MTNAYTKILATQPRNLSLVFILFSLFQLASVLSHFRMGDLGPQFVSHVQKCLPVKGTQYIGHTAERRLCVALDALQERRPAVHQVEGDPERLARRIRRLEQPRRPQGHLCVGIQRRAADI